MRYISAIVMVMALLLAGCQGFWSKALPVITDIIVKVMDAEQQLDAIEQGVNAYLKAHPSPAAEQALREGISATRSALRTALAAAEGARATGEGDPQLAFEQYRQAYQQLVALLTQLGILDANGMLLVGPGSGRVLDPPLAMSVP